MGGLGIFNGQEQGKVMDMRYSKELILLFLGENNENHLEKKPVWLHNSLQVRCSTAQLNLLH
jgi:hypothetical protein